ncbi:MAG: hypothetical protein MSD82_04270 [Prevotella sp.]|nr:hypothetical protein [Prevotella sp.]
MFNLKAMGWDVVEIGLKHKLPVQDAFATARDIAKRLNRNVRLFARNDYMYDKERNLISSIDGREVTELQTFRVDDSDKVVRMIAERYQIKQILEQAGEGRLRSAKFSDACAHNIIDELDDPFELYELYMDEDDCGVAIFEENIDLDIYVTSRWSSWEHAFHKDSEFYNKNWLMAYRMQFFERAQLFGCEEVIICSDQGPTQQIYDAIDLSSSELVDFARSYKYLDNMPTDQKERWKMDARQIYFPDVFTGQFHLNDNEFVEVIFDDFKDLKA